MNDAFAANLQRIEFAIVMELVALTPEWWKHFTFEVTFSLDGRFEKYAHCVHSQDGPRDYIELSGEIYETTRQLGELFQENGKRWRRVVFQVDVEGPESVHYESAYEY
jgi:hypothetical protein